MALKSILAQTQKAKVNLLMTSLLATPRNATPETLIDYSNWVFDALEDALPISASPRGNWKHRASFSLTIKSVI